MEELKQQLEEAIVLVGESLNIKKEQVELLLKNIGIISTIKELTYKMFTENKQTFHEKDYYIFKALSLIRVYCKEMSKNGEVYFTNFEKGDVVEFCNEQYFVIENNGTTGVVNPFGETFYLRNFSWKYQDEETKFIRKPTTEELDRLGLKENK